MQADSPIAQRWQLMREHLNERQRRTFAAAEARVLGRGGIAQVVAATGMMRNTIVAGMRELDGTDNEFIAPEPLAPATATRRSGGGRKTATHKDPTLVPDLLALVDPSTRGDPESPLRWTCKSLRTLADELRARGHAISHVVVAELLKLQGYSLQGNAKVVEGNQSPDRNAQFEPAMFHAMDHLGAAQFITRLGLTLDEPGVLEAGKNDWLQAPEWQALRHYVEDTFVLTDPFELFVAQNLALDGQLYPLIYGSFVDEHIAIQGGTAVAMLTAFMPEWHDESARWIDAVVKTAASESGANHLLISGWARAWSARAAMALEPVARLALGENGSAALQAAQAVLSQRLQKAGLAL